MVERDTKLQTIADRNNWELDLSYYLEDFFSFSFFYFYLHFDFDVLADIDTNLLTIKTKARQPITDSDRKWMRRNKLIKEWPHFMKNDIEWRELDFRWGFFLLLLLLEQQRIEPTHVLVIFSIQNYDILIEWFCIWKAHNNKNKSTEFLREKK